MPYCKHCGVNITTPAKHCVLCKQSLEKGEEGQATFPPIAVSPAASLYIKKMMGYMVGIFIFTVLVDIFTEYSLWFLVGSVGCMLLGVGLLFFLETKANIGSVILRETMLVIAVAVVIDYILGFDGWALGYVAPIACFTAVAALTVMTMIKPSHYKEYFLYQIAVTAILLGNVVLCVLGISQVRLPTLIAAALAVGLLFALFSFFRRQSKDELSKRVHF